MDYNSLMEEARAKQEERTKKWAKVREQQKRSEIEKQRKVQEKQKKVQTNLNKISRIKQDSSQFHSKESELQVKQSRKALEDQNKKTSDYPKKKTGSVVKTAVNTNNLKPENNIHKTTTTTTTTTITRHSQINTNEYEMNKVSSKPTQLPIKKAPHSYNELMELAHKNTKDGHTKKQTENSFNIPIPKINRTEEKTTLPGAKEKRKITEVPSTKTQTQTKKQKVTDTSIEKKKAKIEAKEEPKPRRRIEPSDFFKKTFDKSLIHNKPIPSINRLKPKPITTRPEEQTSEDDDDDFIVSGDDNPGFNVSAFIQNMFRYNKNKYANEDEGAADESMVSSFTQQQYEERRSARIGKLEDLEDMRREEEMIEKLAAKKKKNKSLKRLQ